MPKPSERPQALQESDFKYVSRSSTILMNEAWTILQYLKFPIYLWYYKQINKAASLDSDVDHLYNHFYNHFLREIFTVRDNFAVEDESRSSQELGTSKRYDFSIRYIKAGKPKTVILCENKKRERESQTLTWTKALNQVVDYALLAREESGQGDPNRTLYLTVNVGTYLRFYELPGDMNVAKDWAPAEGRYYELADDEEEVWNLWNQLRDLVKSY